MPAPPSAQKDQDVNTLIEEFHHYTKDWAHRLSQIESKENVNSVSPEVVQEVLTLINGSPTNQSPAHHRIQLFVSEHMHEGLTLKDLSDFFGYSEKYCSEFFRQQMGESFSSYLRRLRLQKAKALLRNTVVGMAEIGETLGFRDQFAFSHFFKKAVGISPREYRNHILKQKSANIQKGHYSIVS